MIINLPNQITMSRLVLAGVCLVLLSQFQVSQPQTKLLYWALGLFILAALTDWLDGYVARKRGQMTALGRILDPFVDKVLICGTFMVYSSSGFVDQRGLNVTGVSAWMVVLIIGSELLVSGVASFCESHGQGLTVTRLGKVKMVVQAVCTGWIMLYVARGADSDQAAILSRFTAVLVWLTVAVTILSGLNYLYQARLSLLEEGRDSAQDPEAPRG